MWEAIFSIASRLNVQVVATTHSSDCINAFARAAQNSSEDGLLIRLEQLGEAFRAVTFDEDELAIIALRGIEVR